MATEATTTNGRTQAVADPIDELLRELDEAVAEDNMAAVLLVATRALVLAERWRPRPAPMAEGSPEACRP
jgi:hypothetical protein